MTDVLAAARRGDEAAFERLVGPYRRELHAHCYRMLGSLHDTEDAMQEAMLRVWRGLDGFRDRQSLRAWLYRIATNTSLDLIGRRKRRQLPFDYAPAADPQQPPGAPVAEAAWIEPYPDEALGIEDAAWSMPPLASWYRGHDELEVFLRNGPLSGEWRWRHLPARANGQLASAAYCWLEEENAHIPFALDVIALEGERIAKITAFVVRRADTPDGYARWPRFAADPERVESVFRRFGLPDRID